MSSEVEEKPKRKQKSSESLEIGRLLGAIARIDPELYEAISKLAEESGDTPTNVVVKSLKNYFLIQKVEATNMNVSQLLLAFDVFSRIAETITKIYTSLGALFFSEMTSSIGEIIEKRVKERLEALSATTAQVEKKPSDIELRLKSKLADVVEGVVEELLRMSFKMSGFKIPEALKVKIPVEVHIEEEKKEEKGVEVKVA
jgi:phosphopantothenoylcysteine synthetase/decarboxylase